jgi:hypothetical protein
MGIAPQPEQKTLSITFPRLMRDLWRLAEDLQKKYERDGVDITNDVVILFVARMGAIPAAILSMALGVRILDTYNLHNLKKYKRKHLLIVDDNVATGETLDDTINDIGNITKQTGFEIKWLFAAYFVDENSKSMPAYYCMKEGRIVILPWEHKDRIVDAFNNKQYRRNDNDPYLGTKLAKKRA